MVFFCEKKLDQHFERESWKVALIVKNFSVHPKIEGLKVVFLLANATLKTKSMDQCYD